MSESRDAWLTCKNVLDGMFSNEVTIEVTRARGSVESYFVPRAAVDKNRVRVKGREIDGLFLATLPTESHQTVFVEASAVELI